MQAKLIKLHPRFELVQDFLRSQERFEPFREVLATDAGRVGCPWKYCGRLKVKKMETLIWEPGKYSRELFLVHSGKIGLFTTLTETQEGHEWGALVATYSHGWFLNTHSFFQ